MEEKFKNLVDKYGVFVNFPEEEKTKDICILACKKNSWNINYINDKYKKSKLFLNICKKDPDSIRNIPPEYHTFLLSEIIFNSSYLLFELYINVKYSKLNYYNKFLKKDIYYRGNSYNSEDNLYNYYNDNFIDNLMGVKNRNKPLYDDIVKNFSYYYF
jgi:hypothetical protein